jgi:hypothetical protein
MSSGSSQPPPASMVGGALLSGLAHCSCWCCGSLRQALLCQWPARRDMRLGASGELLGGKCKGEDKNEDDALIHLQLVCHWLVAASRRSVCGLRRALRRGGGLSSGSPQSFHQ